MKISVEEALASAESGEEFIQGIETKINEWLADREIDDRELKEILEIEAAVRAGIEEHLLEFQGNPKAAGEKYPGHELLILSWFHLAGLVLLKGVNLNPFSAERYAGELILSPAARYAVRELAAYGGLSDYIVAQSLAALLFMGFSKDIDLLNDLLDEIEDHEPAYGEKVRDTVLAIEDSVNGVSRQNPSLSPVSEYLAAVEEVNRKDFDRHYRGITSNFIDEGFVSSLWVSDSSDKSVGLIFSDKNIAIAHSKNGVRYVPIKTVRAIVVGSSTERMHTGFTHTDYHKWTIDIYTETGAIYEYSHLLGTDNQDLNSQREYVTSVLNAVGDYYPVTASGNHSVSESGYRTTMSYWF